MFPIENLKSRALYLKKARDFFSARDILEVDCPILSEGAPLDHHIDIFSTKCPQGKTYFLHSSPEYGMKRLLSAGAPDIYQISHVFRQGEASPLHNPEFTMVEWYRLNYSFEKMMEETVEFLEIFFGKKPKDCISYQEAMKSKTGIDYRNENKADLLDILGVSLSEKSKALPFHTLLPLAFSLHVEPSFAEDHYTIIYDFPKEQAALSRIEKGVSKRFEIYYKGYELANGYLENRSKIEQKKRFESILKEKPHLKMDSKFLASMDTFPNCSGVAVGFDRLMMLALNESDIRSVIPIAWDEA